MVLVEAASSYIRVAPSRLERMPIGQSGYTVGLPYPSVAR